MTAVESRAVIFNFSHDQFVADVLQYFVADRCLSYVLGWPITLVH
jgi:hypothetical protein